MNAYDRLAESESECVGHRGADQQRAGETGSLRVCDAVEILQRRTGLGEHALRERHDPLDVIARRELRNHAAKRFVHRDLRVQCVRKQSTRRVVDGDTCFVAGSFDAKDKHRRIIRVGGTRVTRARITRRSRVATPYEVHYF